MLSLDARPPRNPRHNALLIVDPQLFRPGTTQPFPFSRRDTLQSFAPPMLIEDLDHLIRTAIQGDHHRQAEIVVRRTNCDARHPTAAAHEKRAWLRDRGRSSEFVDGAEATSWRQVCRLGAHESRTR